MSEHPPIPPNCKHFKLLDGRWAFMFNPKIENDPEYWMLDKLDQIRPTMRRDWRFVIACVARSAWIDEAKRLRQLASSLFNDNAVKDKFGLTLSADHPVWVEYTAARNASVDANVRAEEWRIWGEQR